MPTPDSGWRGIIMPVMLALLGAGLLALAVPRAVAALVSLPGGPVLARVQAMEPVGPEALDILIGAEDAALAWVDSGRRRTDRALALLLRARQGDAVRDKFLADSVAGLRSGLARAPANSFAWTRLAYAETTLNGPSPASASALRMGLITAPHEPRLLMVRLELCLQSWDHFAPADRALVDNQIRAAWRRAPDRVIDLVHLTRRATPIYEALRGSRDDVVEFGARLRAGH